MGVSDMTMTAMGRNMMIWPPWVENELTAAGRNEMTAMGRDEVTAVSRIDMM